MQFFCTQQLPLPRAGPFTLQWLWAGLCRAASGDGAVAPVSRGDQAARLEPGRGSLSSLPELPVLLCVPAMETGLTLGDPGTWGVLQGWGRGTSGIPGGSACLTAQLQVPLIKTLCPVTEFHSRIDTNLGVGIFFREKPLAE